MAKYGGIAMTEELLEKNRLEMEKDLGIIIEPYTLSELETLYRLVNMACYEGEEG
jgi:hypothetical protein